MNVIKCDLACLTEERMSKYLPVDEFKNPSTKARSEILSHYGIKEPKLIPEGDRLVRENLRGGLESSFLLEKEPTILEAHANKTQKISRTFNKVLSPSALQTYRLLYFRPIMTSEKDGEFTYDYTWKLNNQMIYPEIRVPERPEPSEQLKKWNKYRESGQFCDATFLIEGKPFKAHQVVMAGFSGYFEKFFISGFKETWQECLDLTNEKLTGAAFEKFLQFAYGQRITLKELKLEELFSLTAFAHKIHSTDLFKLCHNKIAGRVSKENFTDTLDFASQVNDSGIKTTCKRFDYYNPSWIDDVDFSQLNVADLYHLQKLVAFLDSEKINNRIVQELQARTELQKQCNRYSTEDKDDLNTDPAAEKARIELMDID